MPISTPQKHDPDQLACAVLAFVLAGKWLGLSEAFLLLLIQPIFPTVGLNALRREIARLEAYDLVDVVDYGSCRIIKCKGWMV